MKESKNFIPPFRFYGRRKGRPLKLQATDLITNFLPHLLFSETHDFEPSKKYALEIGFGRGEHLLYQAESLSDYTFLGVEAFQNGVAHLLKGIEKKSLKNIMIYPSDIRNLITFLPKNCFDIIFILFPDPWPKIKHLKRRLINDQFLREIFRVIKPEGELRFASDDQFYIENVISLIKKFPLKSLNIMENKPDHWPWTRYNQKAIYMGRKSYYIQVFFDDIISKHHFENLEK